MAKVVIGAVLLGVALVLLWYVLVAVYLVLVFLWCIFVVVPFNICAMAVRFVAGIPQPWVVAEREAEAARKETERMQLRQERLERDERVRREMAESASRSAADDSYDRIMDDIDRFEEMANDYERVMRELYEREQAAARAAPVRDRAHFLGVLGLGGGATKEDARSAYIGLTKQYHPDKVTHLGPELREFAENKMKSLSEAYQAVTR